MVGPAIPQRVAVFDGDRRTGRPGDRYQTGRPSASLGVGVDGGAEGQSSRQAAEFIGRSAATPARP